uniref:Uncharacterized protein n=1 Tax=Anopheles farauti TaxID=69004 RepID=A0A182QXJ0_9DIPT
MCVKVVVHVAGVATIRYPPSAFGEAHEQAKYGRNGSPPLDKESIHADDLLLEARFGAGKVEKRPFDRAGHHQLQQRLERCVSPERATAPVAGCDAGCGWVEVWGDAKPGVRFPELAPYRSLPVLAVGVGFAPFHTHRIQPDETAPAPAGRVTRRIVPVVRLEREAGRVVSVGAEALGTVHEVGLRFAQRLEQQPADEQLRVDDAPDLLLHATVPDHAAAEEPVREHHLQQTPALVFDRAFGRNVQRRAVRGEAGGHAAPFRHLILRRVPALVREHPERHAVRVADAPEVMAQTLELLHHRLGSAREERGKVGARHALRHRRARLREGAEEGVGEQAGGLLLRHGHRVVGPLHQQRDRHGEQLGQAEGERHHAGQRLAEERGALLLLALLLEQAVQRKELVARPVVRIVPHDRFLQLARVGDRSGQRQTNYRPTGLEDNLRKICYRTVATRTPWGVLLTLAYGELEPAAGRYSGFRSFTGSGCASVLKTQSSSGSSESSENSRYRYSYLHRIPAPVTVLLVMRQAPHDEVALERFRPQDVVLLLRLQRLRFHAVVEAERFRPEPGVRADVALVAGAGQTLANLQVLLRERIVQGPAAQPEQTTCRGGI